jgi:hypothetical protein
MVRLGNLRDLDAFFTDRTPPPAICELLEESDVRLHVAGAASMAAEGQEIPPPVPAIGRR